MNINHVALWTNHLEEMKDFYIKFFNAKPNEKYINSKKNFESYFLSFDNGTRLELMTIINKNFIENIPIDENTGYTHISFSAGSKEKVDELTEQLRNEGYKIFDGPRTTGDGYYETKTVDFDGNIIEITI